MAGPWDCQPARPCCTNHDGPHLPDCILPRATDGFQHQGPCILPAPQGDAA